MKLTRLALFIKFFTLEKNKAKLNKFINIGIFLTIFAFVSACISFYYETKLNQLEYENNQYYIDIKNVNNTIRELTNYVSRVSSMVAIENESTDLYEYINSRKLGKNLLTDCDLYLPFIFNEHQGFQGDWVKEFFLTKEELLEIYKVVRFAGQDNPSYEDDQGYKAMIEGFDAMIELEKIVKNYGIFYDDIFNYKSILVLIDQTWNKWCDKHNLKIKNDYYKFREKSYIVKSWYEEILITFKLINGLSELSMNALDEKIKKNSAYKFRSILIAFILQVLVFLIIQSFEIISFRDEVKNVNKNKK